MASDKIQRLAEEVGISLVTEEEIKQLALEMVRAGRKRVEVCATIRDKFGYKLYEEKLRKWIREEM